MSIGTLHAKILLHDQLMYHCGNSDPVTGIIALAFRPNNKGSSSSNAELFGPLKLSVVFHGRAKTKVWRERGKPRGRNREPATRSRVPLFSQTKLLYDDSFKLQAGQTQAFPFQLTFPERIEAKNQGVWVRDPKFDFGGNVLPPSFRSDYFSFVSRYEAFIEYRVGVDVQMQGLKVDIRKPEKYSEPLVLYERPRLTQPIPNRTIECGGTVIIQNEFLLPEDDRPSGVKQKAKAALTADYFPTYAFDWKCTTSQHLYLGQAIKLEVSVRPREKECTAAIVPDVILSSLKAEIRAYTAVRTEKEEFGCPQASVTQTVATLTCTLNDKAPFSKANDWTKTGKTKLLTGIASVFQTYNIYRSYSITIQAGFTVAGKEKNVSENLVVAIHPPLQTQEGAASSSGRASTAVTSSSSRRIGVDDLAPALPEYERPPEYYEATEAPPSIGMEAGAG